MFLKPYMPTPEIHYIGQTCIPGGGGSLEADPPPDAPPGTGPHAGHAKLGAVRWMGVPGHGGDQVRGEPRGHGRTRVRASGCPGPPAGWLLMVGGSCVVHYNTPPVLLHVTLLEKNLCVGKTFGRSAHPTDNPTNVHA